MAVLSAYSGNPVGIWGETLTCGQFLSQVDDLGSKLQWNDKQTIQNVTDVSTDGFALWLADQNCHIWSDLKEKIIDKFQTKLGIREKVELRRGLLQRPDELVSCYYERCENTEHLIADDLVDAAFQREVLIHFILGLRPELQQAVINSDAENRDQFYRAALFEANEVKKEKDISLEEEHLEEVKSEPLVDIIEEPLYEPNLNHKTKKKHKCDTCGQVFHQTAELKAHNLEVHKTEEEEQKLCSLCHVTIHDLEEHTSREHNSKHQLYKCPTCQVSFRQVRVYKRHVEATGHVLSEFKCNACGQKFFGESRLIAHRLLKHRQDTNKFYCEPCNKEYPSHKSLRLHIRTFHTNRSQVDCPMCDKKIVQAHLKKHIKRVHQQEKPYVCETCGTRFVEPHCLRVHKANVHRDDSDQVQCSECDVVLRHRRLLAYHMTTVHSPGTFVCELCGKAYNTKATLKVHTVTDHTNNAGKTLQCNQCDFKGRLPCQLKKHVALFHNKERNYQCDHCPKDFNNATSLRDHINAIHLNVKPYKCDQCDYATAYKDKLVPHKRAAHEMKKVQCPFCPYQTGYSTNMLTHKRRRHPEEMAIKTN